MRSIIVVSFIAAAAFGLDRSPPKMIQKVESMLVKNPIEKNWGIYNARTASHIDVKNEWAKVIPKCNPVTVAVIDTGVDSKHPDLQGNVVLGWNFVDNREDTSDQHGHGTHVAGVINWVANGLTGHCVKIMPIKYFAETNTGAKNLRNTVKAIYFAIHQGAQVINYSGGGPEFAEEEYVALKEAEAKGIIVVAAAGNERADSDKPENYYYPSGYRLTNIISVAATDINNKLIRSSNWGKTKVDVAAPGENILSTLPDNRFGFMTGTSQATSFVTGIVALLLEKDPTLSPARIKEIIRTSADPEADLKDKVATGARVNARRALATLGQ
jgi:thermitase